ncbi:MAG TPA: DUF6484 domain-containing protein [Hyalangium sp.]|nr:DUF6484 domain-containing protein [Hyalangium sp.]
MGWLVGVNEAGLPLVDFHGNPAGPCVARRTVPLEPEPLQRAVAQHQGVVLLFENGDPRLPLIIGLVQTESATPLLDEMLAGSSAEAPSMPEQEGAPEPEVVPAQPVEAHVDGKRVVIEGADEVVLKCGQASITLRRNGKLIIKGTYVETHSTGVNRIKGGSVQIN